MGDRLRALRRPSSARLRILGWFAMLILLAGGASLLLQQQILLARHDAEVERALRQEAEELRILVSGTDPSTGQPFDGDVEAIFDTFLRRNIPDEGESLLTFVDGRPFRVIRGPVDLRADPALMARWGSLQRSEQGEVETAAGPVRYLAVPVLDGDQPRGVFVVANFLQGGREEILRVIQIGALVFGAVVLVALVLAWLIAGRVLGPIRTVTATARRITETDLSRRIAVPDTHDEVADLARTFNDMLGRLQAAFASQRAFLDDVGHELRTPITIIRGHLELSRPESEDAAATHAIVIDELDRMNRLARDLVLMARAEAPDFLRPEPVDLDLLTEELHDKATAMADRRFEVVARAHGVVVADRQRLTQAVVNLIDNAVRHSEPDTPVEIGSRLDDGHAELWVTDHGPGIAASVQGRIFDRFAQDGERGGSAGLGLAIVRAVAEAHGGTASVRSRPGHGSTFTITIPTEPLEATP